MKKNNLMKTAEFAKFCGTTRDTILWYDKTGILKPSHIDENGYRYYSTRQFFTYNLISILKQSGSSNREIKKYFEGTARPELKELFMERSGRLSELLDEFTRMKKLVDVITDHIRIADSCEIGKPKIVYKQEAFLAVTEVRPEESWMNGNEEECLYEHFKTYASRPEVSRYPLGSVISKESFFNGECIDKYLFNETTERTNPETHLRRAGYYVQIFHKGWLDTFRNTFRIVREYLEANQLVLSGDIYEYDIMTFLLSSREDSVFEFLFPISDASAEKHKNGL